MNSPHQEQVASRARLQSAVPATATGRDSGRAAALHTHRIVRCA